MDLTLLIHPVIVAGAVLMVLTAYLPKTRKKLHFRLHYAAGILAFSLSPFLSGSTSCSQAAGPRSSPRP